MALEIRPICAEDKPEWAKLWTGYLAFYHTELPTEVFDSTFSRLLSDNPHDFNGLLAVLNDKPVGLTHYLFHRHGWKIENTCYLQDLWAEPDVRGHGIGRALIEAVYAEADKAGAPSVYWLTQEDNLPARQLYDRVGKLTPFIKYQRP
ncbi:MULTISPECIES: GNAT family N-acetyltransferase [Halocynthiibacter]|uniref:GNAT family N-acetyltransferase n=1 Tax=Halocynthiibacter halioticoli TaxID=2986804 RepID=A0AAE3LQ91_9RHOB|nr:MULTISPECIES: GNAT family N-acetyltransferase [Halocynthiibacter]MCV6824217.1 GNAT family N-acetyltransferase [Halocynthiibacter halioticoli]MCW4057218.1 GNAT family N-acetyltransferase [Halocynthiibacter sp. SDUM655004]